MDEISCTAAIMACGRASEWQVALLLLAKTPGKVSQKLRQLVVVLVFFSMDVFSSTNTIPVLVTNTTQIHTNTIQIPLRASLRDCECLRFLGLMI